MAKLQSGTRIYGTGTVDTKLIVSGNEISISTETGALVVAGGVGIGGDLYVGGGIVADRLIIQYTTITTQVIVTDDIIATANTTNATGTDTGALIVGGGVGIGRDLWVGGTIYSGGSIVVTTSSIKDNAVVDIVAGTDTAVVSLDGTVTVWNTSTLQSVTERGNSTDQIVFFTAPGNSTGINSGTIVISGGVGIGQDLYVGGRVYSQGSEAVTTATIKDNAVVNIIAGTDTSIVSIDGVATIWNSSTLQSVTDRGNSTDRNITITNTSSAFVGTSTAALSVAGGVIIGENLLVEEYVLTPAISVSEIHGLIGNQGIVKLIPSDYANTLTGNSLEFIADTVTNTFSIQSPGTQTNVYLGDVNMGLVLSKQTEQVGISIYQPGVTTSTWYFNSDGRTQFPGYIFPANDGQVGQGLATDGLGNLSFVDNPGYTGSYGPTGYSGSRGLDGNFGGATFGYYFNNDLDTGADPSPGKVKINNFNWSLANTIAVSNLDIYGTSLRDFLLTVTESTNSSNKGYLKVTRQFEPGNWTLFKLGNAVEDHTYWVDIPIVYVNGNTTPYSNDDPLFITFSRTGDLGFVGSFGYTGSQGYSGSQGYTGSEGYVGSQGYTGSEGYTGSQGIIGYVGSPGQGGGLGAPGYTGSYGVFGGDSLHYVVGGFSAVDAASTGTVTFDGVSAPGSSYIFINSNDADGASTTGWLTNLEASTNFVKGSIRISRIDDSRVYVDYRIYSSTNQSGYFAVDVAFVAAAGSLQPNDNVVVSFARAGDVGYSGSVGSGYTGSEGYVGSQGDLGYTGSIGIGFTGSQSYTGSQGDLGYTGSIGIGFTGSQSYTGSQGDLGYTGSIGIGFTGSQSFVPGFVGSQGPKGDAGTSVTIVGSAANYASLPAGYTGNIGDGYITTDNGHLNVWDGDSWTDVGQIIGFTGSLGYVGSAGAGYTGSASTAAGYAGSQGVGYVGSEGYVGSIGYTGSQGYSGSRGYTGSEGTVGFTGSQGQKGDPGEFAAIGYTGSTGAGYAGSFGYTGSRGTGLTRWLVKTANFTMSNNDRVIANTLGGTFVITLPASPTLGDYLQISDGGDFSVNQLIVEPNGSTVEGLINTQIGLDIANTTYEFLYDGTTWQISATTGRAGYVGSTGADGAFAGMGYTGSYGIGYTGSFGYTGSGARGEKGYVGSSGPGFTGSRGPAGFTGYQGSTGEQGIQGIPGDLGYTGSAGPSGLDGAAADKGFTGSQGLLGYYGSIGPQGIQGYMGYTGSSYTSASIYIISAVMSAVLGM
jgi:hypothetical protein